MDYLNKHDNFTGCTFRDALNSKSYNFIKKVELLKGNKINVKKHFEKIIQTNSTVIVVLLIENPEMYVKELDEHLFFIVSSLSKELIFYLLKERISVRQRDMIIECMRVDVLKYYLQKGIDLCKDVNLEKFLASSACNDEFLIFLYSRGVSLDVRCIRNVIESGGNLMFVNWVFSEMSKEFIKKCFNYVFEKTVDLDPMVVFRLYDEGYKVCEDIYTFAVCNNMVSRLREIDNKEIINKNILVHKFKHGVFNTKDIAFEQNDRMTMFKLLYYAIKFDETQLYVLIGEELEIPISNAYIEIANKLDNDDCLYDYDLIKTDNNCGKFLLKYMNSIIDKNCIKIVDNVTRDYRCDISVGIEYLKRGMSRVIDGLIGYDMLILSKLSKDHIICVCRTGGFLLKACVDGKLVDERNIVKYCSLKTSLLYLKEFKIDIRCSYKNRVVVRYGNFDIIDYCCKYGSLNIESVFIGFLNCQNVSRRIIASRAYVSRPLSDLILHANTLQSFDANRIQEYYNLISEFVNDKQLNIIMDNKALGRTIKSNNVLLYKQVNSEGLITKDRICDMIRLKSFKLIEYIGSMKKLINLFCIHCDYDEFIEDAENVINSLTCHSCRDLLKAMDLCSVVKYFIIYLKYSQ